jgi:hypothetical protein
MCKKNTAGGLKAGDCVVVKESAFCCKGRKGRVSRIRPASEGRPIIVKVAKRDDSTKSPIIAFDRSELVKKNCTADWPV